MAVYKKVADVIASLDLETISQERKNTLQPLVDFIQGKVDAHEAVRINFICTHNSRRSHLAQLWSQVVAHHFEIPKVTCFSGGTETTAMASMIGETLQKSGFDIQMLSTGDNPVFAIKYAENEHPVIAFSKKLDDTFNPSNAFAAVMTCSQADGGCPFIAGAEKRIPITFEDPKVYDGTPEAAAKYEERSLQIATEMYYVFSKINA